MGYGLSYNTGEQLENFIVEMTWLILNVGIVFICPYTEMSHSILAQTMHR